MKRRTLLLGATALCLAACVAPGTTTPTVPSTLQGLASDASLIATGLSNGLAPIAGVSAVLKNDLATVATDAATVEKAVNSGSAPGAPTVQEIVSTVSTIADVVLPAVPGGAAYLYIALAAQALLPGLLAAVGITGATPPSKHPLPDVVTARVTLIKAARG